MNLKGLVKPEHIFVGLPGSDRPTVLKAIADRLTATSDLRDAEVLYERLLEREELGSTGIGGGVAIPHCKFDRLEEVIIAVGTCRREVDFAADDGQPVRLLFLVVSPENKPAEHLRSLSAISKWVKTGPPVGEILDMEEPAAILATLQTEGT